MHEQITMKGFVKILFDSGKVYKYENLITDAGLAFLLDALAGDTTDPKIKYFAIGTGTTSPTTSDTQLENEVFRKEVVAVEKYTDQIVFLGYVSSTDYVGDISEIGLFCGDATSAPNTGTLFARVVIPTVTKTNDEGFTVEWRITFNRG